MVSAINCPTARAYEQMMFTKRRFGKLGGNVAYHGYQSFREGEVTPEEAHEIGIKSAKKMWGDEHEIVVTTHLNTDNTPLHNLERGIEYQLSRVKHMGTLEAMFYLLIELLKPMKNPPPNYNPPHSPTLRQELAKFDTYKKQFKLMQSEEITTEAELDLFISKISEQIKELEEERNSVDNKRRRAKTDNELEGYKAEKREISAKIKPLRDKLRLANGIKENIPKVQMALDSERALENKILKQELKKERKSR